MVTLVYLATDAEGVQCIQTSEMPAATYNATMRLDGGASEALTGAEGVRELEGQDHARCTGPDAEPVEELNPGVVAWMVWSRLETLPSPTVSSRPGRVITGLPAYLEIGGPQTLPLEFGPAEALGFNIRMNVASRYEVDWGDGTTTTMSSQGGPYPDGDVWHDYTHRDPDNVVTVTQRWTARWAATAPSGATATGSIDTPLFTSATLALPITEVQAVVGYWD
jgi:hypothetical protein